MAFEIKAYLGQSDLKKVEKQYAEYIKIISDKYKIKVTADTTGFKKVEEQVKKQIQNINGGKGIKLLDSKEIDLYTTKMKNALERLQIGKDTVFAKSEIQKEVADFTSELNKLGTSGAKSTKELGVQFDTLRTNVLKTSNEFKNVNKDGYSFIQMVELAGKKIAIWGISTSLVYGSLRQLKDGVVYITELDNALNEIRIVTGKTQEQVTQLAKSYNVLAKEMSVTTKEISSEAANLFRQGLDSSQVEERMKAIIQYAKISSISLQESDKIITATANATGESVEKIIDIFAMLGDSTASGADEIGEALQRVASAAENSNLSLEKTASWIATISSITRESASTIGRSISSIISRYESIKSTGFNSEDATKLNDVVEALDAVKIKATDAEGQLRPFAEVVDELGAKFDTLSKNEQAYIVTTMFGTYQRNRGLTLLKNYNTSLKNFETALNSAGTAEQKFAIYQESTNAKLDRATASIEGFWQNAIDSDTVKIAIDGFSSLVDILDVLVNNSFSSFIIQVGLMSTGIVLLGKGFNALKLSSLGTAAGVFALDVAEKGLIVTTKALTASMLASPLFAVVATVATIYGIIKATDALTTSLEEQKEKVNSLTTEIQTLQSAYDQLNANKNRTTEQEKYLTLLEQELKDKKELLEIETQRAIKQEFFTPSNSKYKSDNGISDSGSSAITSQISELKQLEEALSNTNTKDEYDKVNKKILTVKTSLEESYKTIQKYINSVDDVPPELQTLADSLYNVIVNTDTQTESINNAVTANNAYRTSYEELNKTFETSTNNLMAYNDMIKELEQNHKLSAENVNKIFKDYPQLLAYLGSEQELREELLRLKDEEVRKQREVYIQMIQDSEEFYNLRIKGNTELTNEIKDKYDIDLKNFRTLAEAKEKIESTLLKSLSQKWGLYFDATRNALTTDYNELLRVNPNMAKQVYNDVAKYFRTGKEFNNIVGKFVSSDFSALNLSKTGSDSKKDTSLSDILKKEQEYQNKIIEAENKSNNLLNEEYETRLKNLSLEEQAQKALLEYYESQRGVAKSKGLEDELNQKILGVQGKLADIEKTRKEINKDIEESVKKQSEEQQKNLTDVQKQIAEVIKKRYEIERDEAEKTHKDRLEQLEDELDAYKENVSEQIKEIERLRDEEDFEKDQDKTTKKISELTNEKNTLAMAAQSGDLSAIERINEIDKQLSEERENLSDLQQDREDELRKQNLQDALDAKEKEIEAAKKAENEKFETIKANYDKLLEEGNLYAEANKALTTNMVTDINGKLVTVADAFKSFSDRFGETLGTLGTNIQTEFIDKLNKAKELINSMGGITYSSTSGGAIPKYKNGGIANFTGLAQLDGSSSAVETVFNAAQGKKLYDFINNLPMMPSFSMNIPKISPVGGNNSMSIGDIIVQAQSNGANSVDAIVDLVAMKLRRELNKSGIFRK